VYHISVETRKAAEHGMVVIQQGASEMRETATDIEDCWMSFPEVQLTSDIGCSFHSVMKGDTLTTG